MLSTLNVKKSFAGNDLNITWVYDFQIYDPAGADVEVWICSPAGVWSQVTTSYSIDTSISTVIYPTVASMMAPLPTGWTLELRRVEALTQPIDITAEVSAVDVASAAQEAVDRLGMAIQQVKAEVDTGVPGPTGATGSMLSAGGITALPAKATPVDNDLMLLEDSADSLKMKKTLWSNIKSTLKTYFDTLYQTILTLPLATGQGGTGATANANAASGVVVLNGSLQLPPVSGALLTNLPITNTIVQVVNNQASSTFGKSANLAWGAVDTGTTAMSIADSIPTNTQGDQFMQLAITPTNASNKLKIEVVLTGCVNGTNTIVMALYQDSTVNALAATARNTVSNVPGQLTLTYYMVAGTATTFKVRAGQTSSDTFTFNGSNGGRIFGGVCCSEMTITEIKV